MIGLPLSHYIIVGTVSIDVQNLFRILRSKMPIDTHVVHNEILKNNGSHGSSVDFPLFEPLCTVHGATDGGTDFSSEVISFVACDLVPC